MFCASPGPPAKASRSGSASSSRVGAVTEYPAASAPVGAASPARSGIAASTGAGHSHGRIPLWRKSGLIVEMPGAERRSTGSLWKRSRPKDDAECRALDDAVREDANRIRVRPESAREIKESGRGRKREASRRQFASRPVPRQIPQGNGLSRHDAEKKRRASIGKAVSMPGRPLSPKRGHDGESRHSADAVRKAIASVIEPYMRSAASGRDAKRVAARRGRREIGSHRSVKGARQCE